MLDEAKQFWRTTQKENDQDLDFCALKNVGKIICNVNIINMLFWCELLALFPIRKNGHNWRPPIFCGFIILSRANQILTALRLLAWWGVGPWITDNQLQQYTMTKAMFVPTMVIEPSDTRKRHPAVSWLRIPSNHGCSHHEFNSWLSYKPTYLV